MSVQPAGQSAVLSVSKIRSQVGVACPNRKISSGAMVCAALRQRATQPHAKRRETWGNRDARPGSNEADPKSGVQDARFVRWARQKGLGMEHI